MSSKTIDSNSLTYGDNKWNVNLTRSFHIPTVDDFTFVIVERHLEMKANIHWNWLESLYHAFV